LNAWATEHSNAEAADTDYLTEDPTVLLCEEPADEMEDSRSGLGTWVTDIVGEMAFVVEVFFLYDE
jgi:hypothetical protein